MKKRIGFDLDGTIVDCSKKQIHCLMEGASNINVKIDFDKVWNLKRNGMNNKNALRSEGVDASNIETISKFWNSNIETPKFLNYDQMFENAYQLIEKLSDRNDLFLISARNNSETLFSQIQKLNIGKFFVSMHAATEGDVAKNKASIMKALKLESYIGDTELDYRACMLSEIDPLIVCTGQRSRDYLQICGVKNVYDDLMAVKEAKRYD